MSQAQDAAREKRQRDIILLFAMGGFFALLGVLVLLGLRWTEQRDFATTVNIVCGALLVAVGVLCLAIGGVVVYRGSADGNDEAAA